MATASSVGNDRTNTVIATPGTPTNYPPVPPHTNDVPYKTSRAGYSVAKTLTSPVGRSAQVGETLTFNLVVANTGDVVLASVPLVDTYESSYLSYQSASQAPDGVSPGSLTWNNIGVIGVGSSRTVSVTFLAVGSSAGQARTNAVIATPGTPTNYPPVPPQTSDVPYKVSRPGYSLTKTILSPAYRSAITGEVVVFRLRVENTGDVALVTVPLVDTYDAAYLAFSNATPAPDSIGVGSLAWNNVGPLAAGQTTDVVVRFVATQETAGSQRTNTVVATPSVPTNEPPVPPHTNDVPYKTDLPAAIGDWVWVDANANGIQDPGEIGLAGVTVTLYDASTNALTNTMTDVNGSYLFSYLPSGTYFVGFTTLPGHLFSPQGQTVGSQDSDANPTTGFAPPITLSSGQIYADSDAGMYQLLNIGDFAWHDVNGNGIQDSGETGLVNVAVSLYDGVGTLLATTNSSSTGYYEFRDLTPGSYQIGFGSPSGYVITLRDQGANDAVDSDPDRATGRTTVNVFASGANDMTWDAGFFQYGSIGDYVWLDANNDGVQDPSEVGMAGIVVHLYNAQSNVIAVTTSTVAGAYGFSNVEPGNYFLGFSLPPSHIFSPANATSDDRDSDVDAAGFTPTFPILSGQVITNMDAGMFMPSSVAISKTPDHQLVVAGSNATFTITVINTGMSALTNLHVADPLGATCEANFASLAAGASTSYQCTVVGVLNNFTNVATVTAHDPYGNVRSDTNDAVVEVIHPSIQIFKTPGYQSVTSGTPAVFTITVTNSGDVALTNVVVVDAATPACNGNLGTLLPGQSVTYSCQMLNVTQSFDNTACVTAMDPLGGIRWDCATVHTTVTRPGSGCTRTASFWYCFSNTWPVATLQIGPATYGSSNILAILCNTTTDVTYRVARELIGAKFNAEAGADISAIASRIVDADNFLTTHPLGSNPGGAAYTLGDSIANDLRQFNNGLIGPGRCSAPQSIDFDGDFVSDIAVYWPTFGRWYELRSALGPLVKDYGWSEALPFAADYDGDGKSDVAVYHPASGTWYVERSDSLSHRVINWGWSEAVPTPADFDGDSYVDLAVYHPATGNWYIRPSTNKAISQVINWGWSTAVPVPADYDGDKKADLAVYHPATGNWYIRQSASSNASLVVNWGWADAIPAPGDYDGDGKTDIAVYHRATGNWYIRSSLTLGLIQKQFGTPGMLPVPGDYDGDSKTDIAVYERASGKWFILRSSNNAVWQQPWGWSEAVPVLPQWQINRWMGTRQGLWSGM